MNGRILRWMRWSAASMLLALGTMLQAQGPVRAVRAINDPATGTRWLLVRAVDHPGGPGRLVRADIAIASASGPAKPAIEAPLALVLRGGDRIVVVERTAVAETEMDAVALGPAAEGATCEARLRVTGRAVRVIALGPGRAELAPAAFAETEQP